MPIFSRVRERISRSGSQSRAEIDPHEWQLPSPSSYPTSNKAGGRETLIPNPRIFRNAFIPNEATLNGTDTSLIYPDISHAAVHLALLECFRGLRLSASRLDVELEPPPPPPPTYSEKQKSNPQPKASERLVEHPTRLPESERWDFLIRVAITRFTAWWTNIDRVFRHATAFTHHAGDKSVVQLTKDYLPPLDVLLVWYAFLLDDEEKSTAAAHDLGLPPQVGGLCFPWPAIRDVLDVDAEPMTFKLSRAAENLFSTLTSQSADILRYLEEPPAYVEIPELLSLNGTDLFAQVKRHEEFIHAAHELLWIRSPALQGSLERSSVEYLDFQLQSQLSSNDAQPHDRDTVVPFGVDLIWKTHRLYPKQYRLFRQGIAPAATDSNCPISETTDSKSPIQDMAVADTLENEHPPRPSSSSLRQYCECWTCERIRDELPSFSYVRPSSTSASTSPTYDRSLLASLSSDQLRSIQDDLGFYRAVQEARRCGLPLPTRPPTAAEKAAEKLEAQKQADVGWLPGLNEYMVTLPNGKKKIKRINHASRFYGMSTV